MALERIVLNNFRSYKKGEFDFSPGVTVITGKNGAGKTNILEAIYVLLKGKSFRDSDEELIRHNEEWWKITGIINNGERELRYQLEQARPKQLYIDGASKGIFTQKQQLPVVLFEPDDLLLLHGAPSRRRTYIDDIAISLKPGYRTVVNKYERALMQRNRLLKKGGSLKQIHDAVFVWDIMLSEYGAEMQRVRQELLRDINKLIETEYSRLAASQNTLQLDHQSSLSGGSQEIAHQLSRSLHNDILRGFTTVGPHRDDVLFLLNNKDARTTASRGEVRTILLALKQAELDLHKARSEKPPLFLLDDVLSELDEQRQAALLNNSTDGVQKIITTTHAIDSKNVTTIQLPS